ncbi:MAG: porin [Hydrogenophaga sp.]|uniref:porin n=1 Tax=Hydrogenophaga sp. TaxID=1904254 RepID=UPI001D1EBDC4|nr:porin [Hydrogenophaga sp.]MBX3610852.1 porin [Hydrogenophaga sp.]
MKKSLIALAALATISGAAFAQSSVTVYGRLDASVGSDKDDIANTSTTKLFSGNLTTSRLGFKGTEDLGGGLRANFQLEGALTVDDGTSAGLKFDRASWVGLSGGFGAVRMGLIDSAYKDIYDLGNVYNLYDSEFTASKIAYAVGTNGGVNNFTSRPTNQVRYDTPSFGGFSAGVSYAFDETAGVSNDLTAFNLRYRAGQLDAGFAYQEQSNSTTPASDLKYSVVSAGYDFGAFRLSGQYQNAKNGAGLKDNEFAFGATVPFGAFDVSAGYAYGKSKLNGATSAKGSAFSFGGTYAMSKRTRLYAAYLTGDVENGAGTKVTDRSRYAVGVRHDF